ncbi:MAG: ABC transporter substrate-binding protein [Firmicutes bacterium]|nr:ABC transporter substrate-binding protein [Bacillota bacterium]
MRRVLLFVLTLVLLLSMTVGAVEPIKIGVNLEMTGMLAGYGQMGWEGLQAFAEFQKLEVLGRPVEFVLVDNKSDKVEAANATSRLIEKENVSAIIGTMTSGNMLAAGPIAEKYGVPMIGPSTTNPLTTQGKKYVFRACFVDSFQAEVAAKFAYEDLGKRRAAIISDITNDYCVALGKYFEKAFVQMGGQVVSKQYIKAGDQDFSAQLTAIKSANPDVIYTPNYYTEDALLAIQAKSLGLDVPMIGSDGADVPEFLQIGKESVEGFMYTGFWHPDAATEGLAKEFTEFFREKYGKDPNAFGALSIDSLMLLLDAIERAGSDDPKAIRDALEASENVQTLTGVITIENGDAVRNAVIKEVRDGKPAYRATINP